MLCLLTAACGNGPEERPTIDRVASFIHVTLDIQVRSKDSIMATVSFRNDSSKKYWIYRAALPSDHLAGSLFSITDNKDYHTVKYSGSGRGEVLYGYEFLPAFVPDMSPDNFLILAPGDSVSFTCNLAGQYDFKSFLDKGVRDFRVNYLAKTPLVVDDKQIFAIDTLGDQRKPVYDIIESNPTPHLPVGWRYIKIP